MIIFECAIDYLYWLLGALVPIGNKISNPIIGGSSHFICDLVLSDIPLRQNSCPLSRIWNPGAAMKDEIGSIWTHIQRLRCGVTAATQECCGSTIYMGKWGFQSPSLRGAGGYEVNTAGISFRPHSRNTR